ncbi:MAG: CBS domain-containing protein, partial [Crocosphaera sp.]|nr:CBS domain-containing protein [Crocosphaera sp.]
MMKAQDIMTPTVVTIRGSATVAEAVKLMKEKGLRALIVEPRLDILTAVKRAVIPRPHDLGFCFNATASTHKEFYGLTFA